MTVDMIPIDINGVVLHIPDEWDAFLYRGYSYIKNSDGVFVQGKFYRSMVGIEQPAQTKRPTGERGATIPPMGGGVAKDGGA